MKVYINTNGCAILRHETYRISKYFRLNGYEEVLNPQEADIAVLTGCGVTENDEDISIDMILKTREQLPYSSTLILSGCLPRIAAKRIVDNVPNIIMIANDEFYKFDELIGVKKNEGTPINEVVYNNSAENKYYFDSESITIDDDLRFIESHVSRTGSESTIRYAPTSSAISRNFLKSIALGYADAPATISLGLHSSAIFLTSS